MNTLPEIGITPSGMPRERHPRDGFTLIELLATIAIIGILAAIVLVTVGEVRASAKQTKSISNQRQIGIAFLTYMAEHKNQPPLPLSEYNGHPENRTLWEWGSVAKPIGFGCLQYEGYLGMPSGTLPIQTATGEGRSAVFFNPLNPDPPAYYNWSDYSYLLSGRYQTAPRDPTTAIGCDVRGGNGAGTPGKPFKGSAAMVLYFDGSVRPVQYSVYSQYPNRASAFDTRPE